MEIQKETIIEIEGKKYKLTKVNALAGSNLLRRYLGSGKTEPKEFLGTLKDEDFAAVQRQCLLAVSRIDDTERGPAAVPVMMADGRWVMEDASGALAFALTLCSFMFQLRDFFGEGSLTGFDLAWQSLNP